MSIVLPIRQQKSDFQKKNKKSVAYWLPNGIYYKQEVAKRLTERRKTVGEQHCGIAKKEIFNTKKVSRKTWFQSRLYVSD